MNCLFGGNSCTWVLILVIVFLLTQGCDNGCGSAHTGNCGCSREYDSCGNCGCGNNCGCGC